MNNSILVLFFREWTIEKREKLRPKTSFTQCQAIIQILVCLLARVCVENVRYQAPSRIKSKQ